MTLVNVTEVTYNNEVSELKYHPILQLCGAFLVSFSALFWFYSTTLMFWFDFTALINLVSSICRQLFILPNSCDEPRADLKKKKKWGSNKLLKS